MTLLEIFDNAAILASTQDANTTEVSILSDASRLIDTACQPNSVNIEDGDIIVWNNEPSNITVLYIRLLWQKLLSLNIEMERIENMK